MDFHCLPHRLELAGACPKGQRLPSTQSHQSSHKNSSKKAFRHIKCILGIQRSQPDYVPASQQTSWDEASKLTKGYYTRKTGQGVASVVKDLVPHETNPLFRKLCSSPVTWTLKRTVNNMLMEALSECYQAASSWEMHLQILSTMADEVRYSKLLQFIPDLTKYHFTEAKRHCLTYGRGAPVPSVRVARTDFTTLQSHS